MDLSALEKLKEDVENSSIFQENHQKRFYRIKQELKIYEDWIFDEDKIFANPKESLFLKLNYLGKKNLFKKYLKHDKNDIGLVLEKKSIIYPFSSDEIRQLKSTIRFRKIHIFSAKIKKALVFCLNFFKFKNFSKNGYCNKNLSKPNKNNAKEKQTKIDEKEAKSIFLQKSTKDIFGKQIEKIADSIIFWDGENISLNHYKKILSKIQKPKEICYVSKIKPNTFQEEIIKIFNISCFFDHEDSDERIRELIRLKNPKHIIIISSDGDFIQISKHYIRKKHKVTFISNSNNFKRIFMSMHSQSNLILF